mmetsp:Transcript_10423/g.63720  ORF Transcript_10423/g.63720 Transcript_10423/m.63720 type:complete len:252 (+) Transcript_10423:2651-3406(+)
MGGLHGFQFLPFSLRTISLFVPCFHFLFPFDPLLFVLVPFLFFFSFGFFPGFFLLLPRSAASRFRFQPLFLLLFHRFFHASFFVFPFHLLLFFVFPCFPVGLFLAFPRFLLVFQLGHLPLQVRTFCFHDLHLLPIGFFLLLPRGFHVLPGASFAMQLGLRFPQLVLPTRLCRSPTRLFALAFVQRRSHGRALSLGDVQTRRQIFGFDARDRACADDGAFSVELRPCRRHPAHAATLRLVATCALHVDAPHV